MARKVRTDPATSTTTTATTSDLRPHVRASRTRVARSRGAVSGVLLIVLGAWAALVPFIGPYFNLAFTPAPNDAWHWTSGRGWLEVLPGAAAVLGGLLTLLSANRIMTLFGAWLAAAGGAWLIVGPSLAKPLHIQLGTPDPTSGSGVRALDWLLFFYGIGAVILFLASLALGRLSVHSVRDVRAAERRAEAEAAAAAEQERLQRERAAEQERAARERAVEDERRHEHDGRVGQDARLEHDGRVQHEGTGPGTGRHDAAPQNADPAYPQTAGYPQQQGGPGYPQQQGGPAYPQQGAPADPRYAQAPPPQQR